SAARALFPPGLCLPAPRSSGSCGGYLRRLVGRRACGRLRRDFRISGIAFRRNAADLANELLELLRAGVLAGGGAGFTRNIFFHQRAAVIVGASLEAELR